MTVATGIDWQDWKQSVGHAISATISEMPPEGDHSTGRGYFNETTWRARDAYERDDFKDLAECARLLRSMVDFEVDYIARGVAMREELQGRRRP